MKKTIEELEYTIPELVNRGDNIQAYRIFFRLLKAVSCSADLSLSVRCSALRKMAWFNWKVKDILMEELHTGRIDRGRQPLYRPGHVMG
jgi:hypothetical protein